MALFANQVKYSTSSRTLSVVVGDLNNNNNILDIVVANYDTHNIGVLFWIWKWHIWQSTCGADRVWFSSILSSRW